MAFSRYLAASALGVISLVVIGVPGCSQPAKRPTISGTVSYNGQRLSSGMLTFVGEKGDGTTAPIQPDGTFIITDVVPGEVKVGILQGPESSGSSGGEKTQGAKAARVNLPDKLRDPQQSGVKYTIAPDTKELHIELK